MANRAGASDLTSPETHPLSLTHRTTQDSVECSMRPGRARSIHEAPGQQCPSAVHEVAQRENRDLETHSAEHGNQSECIDWSLSISRDDVAGAKGTATLSVSHVPSHMVMRDPSVTNDAESTSSSQSSEAVEDDINDQNIVGEWDSGWPGPEWEFAIVHKDDNIDSESSSYDYTFSNESHTLMHGMSFRRGPPDSVYDEFHHREIPRNSDRANTYSSRLNDAYARKFGYPANEGFWPQVPASYYHHSTPDFMRLACPRRSSFPPISSFPAWDQAEDEEIPIEEVPLHDLLHHRYSDIELFQNEGTWPLLPKAADLHGIYECAPSSLIYYPSKESAVRPSRASDTDFLDLENPSKTLTEVHPKRASDPDILEIENLSEASGESFPRLASNPDICDFEDPSRTPTEILPERWSDPEIIELRIGQLFQYSSTIPTDEMPDLHISPDMNETPESLRHARYQARPGKCHHNSVLRYWINEDAPERVCDICGGTARFLWSCTADTPDWIDASPRSAGPAPAVPAAPAANEHASNVSSSFDIATNKSASPGPPTNFLTLAGFSSISSASSGLAAPPSLAFNKPASTGPSQSVRAPAGFCPINSAPPGLAEIDPTPTGPAATGPTPTSSATNTTGPDISILAEWMQEAIAKGEYTPAQVQKLVNQKLQVFECAARDRAAQAERAAKAAHAARPSTAEGTTVREWLVRQADRESHLDDDIQEDLWNGGPCRAMFCPLCHWEFTERSLGHIDQIVNEPYVAPPNIPEYLNRPISDAAVLRAMRPMHWMRGREFGLWWQENRYSSGRDMAPVLRHALNGEWTEEQFKIISWWVYWHCRSDREVGACVKWLEARNLEQISSFSQSIADSHFIIPRSSERQCSPMSMGLDPVLSISRHPIWEEYESQEGLVVYPGWEYSLGHRWQALSRPEHRDLTRLVTEQQNALVIQGVSSAPSKIAFSSQELTQKTEVAQQIDNDFDSLCAASDRE